MKDDLSGLVSLLHAAGLSVETWHRVRVSVDERRFKVLGVFKDGAEARRAGAGAGWYGEDGNIESLMVVVDGRTRGMAGYALGSPERVVAGSLREQALAKLTAEERKALGL